LNWRRHHTPLNLPTIPAALTASVLLFMRLRKTFMEIALPEYGMGALLFEGDAHLIGL